MSEMGLMVLEQSHWTCCVYLCRASCVVSPSGFSAGDVAPLTRWAKLMMMLQSAISVAAIALVIARAVNILG